MIPKKTNASQASEQLELAKKKEDQVEAKALVDGAKQSLARVHSDLAELGKANTFPFYILLDRNKIKWTTSYTTSGATHATLPTLQISHQTNSSQGLPNNSGSLAKFTAILRASSRVRSFAADLLPASSSK